MSTVHHLHHFFIRHGKEIYCLVRDTAIILGLIWLSLMLSRWLVYSFPTFIV